jgi:hypothetical protein
MSKNFKLFRGGKQQEVQLGPAPKPLVFLMTPARQAVEGKTVLDIVKLMGLTKNATVDFVYYEGTYLNAVRDGMIQLAIDKGADYILFVDSDMRFPSHTIDTLLAAKQDCVAANYASRTQAGKTVAYDEDHNCVYSTNPPGRYQEVVSVGTGLMLLKVDLLKKIPAPRCFMPWDTANNGYVGEDVYLCHMIRKFGGHVFVDHELSKEVRHIGTIELETP